MLNALTYLFLKQINEHRNKWINQTFQQDYIISVFQSNKHLFRILKSSEITNVYTSVPYFY